MNHRTANGISVANLLRYTFITSHADHRIYKGWASLAAAQDNKNSNVKW